MRFPSNPRNGQSVRQFGRKFVYDQSVGVWNPVVSSASVAEIRKVETSNKTTFYQNASNLPLSNNTIGELAFVQENSRMYVWSGTGWYSIATVSNANATVTGVNQTYNLASDGTPTTITLNATGTSGGALTWSYVVSSGNIRRTATVTQNDNTFIIVPSTDPKNIGNFKLTFSANDGGNIISHTAEFTLTNQSPTITQSPDAFYQLASDGTPTSIALQATDPENNPITWSYRVVSGALGGTTVTNLANVFTITPSQDSDDEGTFVLEFIASDGAGTDSVTSTFELTLASPIGQQAFTTPGTYSWTVPSGVDSISVVCVGGGGGGGSYSSGKSGGGGALAYVNNISVTSGEVLSVVVGQGGVGTHTFNPNSPSEGQPGGNSLLRRSSNNLVLCEAQGGGGDARNGNGGTVIVGTGGSGGNGGSSGRAGGAGGYSGNGGNGGQPGIGGGGGGGGQYASGTQRGGGGGGVGIFGEGSSGAAGNDTGVVSNGGQGGSGGSGGVAYQGTGGSYGGGGASGYSGGTYGYSGGQGGRGAVRIIWGDDRAFPSTNTQNM